MKILSLELKGCYRLMLRHIKYFKIEPKEMVQLILGTNGSGKSSVMFELSPLPASEHDYEKGGFKIITISHKNSTYVLKSLFNPTGKKFCFIKDDEELNPTGSITLYTELVRKTFNYTKDIHELLTGITRFHSMDVATRRNWLTRLSEQDFTYALSYYKRLQERYRDSVGGHRVLNERLAQVTSKLMRADDEIKYRKDIDDLRQIINILLEQKAGKFISREETVLSVNEAEIKLTKLTEALKKGLTVLTTEFVKTENVSEEIAVVKAAIIEAETKLKQQIQFADKEIETAEALKRSGVDSFESIEKHIKEFHVQIKQQEDNKVLNLEFSNPEQALRALDVSSSSLSDIFSQIEANKDGEYSVKIYQDLIQEEKIYLTKLQQLIKQGLDLQTQKDEQEHQRDHNKLECPKCQHSWSRGFVQAKYNQLKAQLAENSKQLDLTTAKTEELAKRIQANRTYLELFRSYTLVTRAVEVLKPLWDHLISSRVIFDNPTGVMHVLNTLKTDLIIDLNIAQLMEKVKEHEKIRELTSKNQDINLGKIQEHIESLNKSVSDLQDEIQAKKLKLQNLEHYQKVYREVKQLEKDIFEVQDMVLNFRGDLVTINKRDILNNFIQSFRMTLSEKEHAISVQSTQRALVENIQQQMAELEDKQIVYNRAIKALSPTDGLIAKNMTGSINHIVRQMNNFIKKVWLYPLEIVPIQPDLDETVELDYKFQLLVNENPRPVPDIKQGSTAIREIVDLAFKQIATKHLHLENIPLHLDEFAASFDKAHRHAAIGVVNQLIATGNFSQVFMISHYEEAFGSFTNTDITVLCNENLGIPVSASVNKVAEIRYS